MKIELDKLSTGPSPLQESRSRKAASKPAADTGTPANSSLQLSDLSSRLKNVEAKLVQGDAFDAQRVAAIKQSIQNGSFNVNAEVVAEKLIANSFEAMGKTH